MEQNKPAANVQNTSTPKVPNAPPAPLTEKDILQQISGHLKDIAQAFKSGKFGSVSSGSSASFSSGAPEPVKTEIKVELDVLDKYKRTLSTEHKKSFQGILEQYEIIQYEEQKVLFIKNILIPNDSLYYIEKIMLNPDDLRILLSSSLITDEEVNEVATYYNFEPNKMAELKRRRAQQILIETVYAEQGNKFIFEKGTKEKDKTTGVYREIPLSNRGQKYDTAPLVTEKVIPFLSDLFTKLEVNDRPTPEELVFWQALTVFDGAFSELHPNVDKKKGTLYFDVTIFPHIKNIFLDKNLPPSKTRQKALNKAFVNAPKTKTVDIKEAIKASKLRRESPTGNAPLEPTSVSSSPNSSRSQSPGFTPTTPSTNKAGFAALLAARREKIAPKTSNQNEENKSFAGGARRTRNRRTLRRRAKNQKKSRRLKK